MEKYSLYTTKELATEQHVHAGSSLCKGLYLSALKLKLKK